MEDKGLGRKSGPKKARRPWKRGAENEGRATQFKPGTSGNPGGRPKNPFPALIRENTKDGHEIVATVLRVLRKSKSDKSRMWAAEWLRDTGWHKPVQGVRGMDDDGNDAPLRIVYER